MLIIHFTIAKVNEQVGRNSTMDKNNARLTTRQYQCRGLVVILTGVARGPLSLLLINAYLPIFGDKRMVRLLVSFEKIRVICRFEKLGAIFYAF